MRIAIGSDHAGFRLKEHLIAGPEGRRPRRRSTSAPTPRSRSTTRRSAPASGREVAAGRAERGIVLGGSGQGEQISANKVRGVRAALCNDLYTAEYSRRHNDANVLSIGARIVAEGLADEILRVWLATDVRGRPPRAPRRRRSHDDRDRRSRVNR